MEPRGCRRPITEAELPHLRAFGEGLRQERWRVGLSQAALGHMAEVGERHVRDLEYGRRRTRLSTLSRLASALVRADQTPERSTEELAVRLVSLAGPALASESPHGERVDRRRSRHVARQAREPFVTHTTSYVFTSLGIAEEHVHEWIDGARRQRRRVSYRMPGRDGRARSQAVQALRGTEHLSDRLVHVGMRNERIRQASRDDFS